jgi:hypothetical protein
MQQIFLNGFLRYRKQLPSGTNTLPIICIVSPAIRACSWNIVTQIRPVPHNLGLLTPSYNATLCIHVSNEPSAPHTTRIVLVTTRRPATGYDRSPPVVRGRPSLFSIPGRSLALDGPTTCFTPAHRTRQRISQHSLSPTSHNVSTSRGRPSVSPLS